MNFLPYENGSSFGWAGAMGTSAVLHGAAVFAVVALAGTTFSVAAQAPAPPPPYQLSVDELDADTLAGLLEQAGLAASDGVEPQDDPNPATSQSDDPVSQGAGSDITDPEGAIPVEVPDTLEIETVDPAAAGEPEETVTPDVETIEASPLEPTPIEPVVMAAPPLPVAPEDVANSPILSETVTALSADTTDTVAVTQVEPIPSDTLTSSSIVLEAVVAPSSTENAVVPLSPAAEAVVSNLTSTQPTAPAAPSSSPPTAQDLAVRDLILRIQQIQEPPCLIALPRRDGAEGVGLAFLAAQEGAMEQFALSLMTAQDVDVRQTRALIDARQCAALEFVSETRVYPAMQIGIQIDQTTVGSGGTLTGVMRGVGGGRFLTLVLVDDNGVVTDLQRFVATAGNVARFDVPVTRVGLTRETRPLIIAIVSERPPNELRTRLGQRAEDVFLDAVITPLGETRIGLVAVDIR